MSDHVVFLGAGASRAMGYALTSEILPEIASRLTPEGRFNDDRLDDGDLRNSLRAVLDAALPGRGERADLPLVTHVLSLLDHCILNEERLVAALDLRQARGLLEWAIVNVLKSPIHPAKIAPVAFAKWVISKSAAVISTNYDVAVDLAMLWEGLDNFDKDHRSVDFGFPWRDLENGEIVTPPQDARLVLYKLHGSLNWLKCPRCGYIYVNFAAAIVVLDGDRSEAGTCHCGETLRAILVAPSFVRTVRDANLLSVWQRALERLRLAERWTFIGYSLPPEDFALRGLILRAYHGADSKPDVHVVTLREEDVSPYRLLFPNCTWTLGGLEAFLP